VHTGQTLRIPGASEPVTPETASASTRSTNAVARTASAKPFKSGPSVTAAASAGSHRVGNGETLFSLGRKFGVSPYEIADANGLPHDAQLTLGQAVRIPGGAGNPVVAAKKPTMQSEKQLASASDELPAAEDSEVAPAKVTDRLAATDPAPAASAPKAETAAPSADQVTEQAPIEGGPAGMRWPVRGKVISAFGPKSNGLKNEGINIAVPEGTSVRAAEGGVVAYAGNELKGYGNLILIRHDTGYVTAYAHAKELFVKRGDTVKRGDVIAKAGQTGSVSSPQLHFEVRKGATALDPIKFLSSSTASN
jgi:murein DD-endopeptidase MepM/ murein hydrolase activator NlpD